MTGKLVNPKDGAWAWYDLRDAETEQGLLMRLAIVGRERVRRRQGHWLEVEIVPMVGYRSVYKMLVTGPASDPSHLHQLLVREGREPVVEMELGDAGASERSAPPEQERRLLGEEDVRTRGGDVIRAQRYELGSGSERVEVWLNDDVAPMGIVRMVSAAGELALRNHGVGGQDARSVIDDPLPAGLGGKVEEMKVEVDPDQPVSFEAPPAPAEPPPPPQSPNTPQPNRRRAE